MQMQSDGVLVSNLKFTVRDNRAGGRIQTLPVHLPAAGQGFVKRDSELSPRHTRG